MKHIILCADDYGQNTAISQAVIDLVKKNRLTATSCMTNSYYWQSHAKWLAPYKDQIDIGLHFNLTEGSPLSKEMGHDPIPLNDLIIKAYLGRLNQVAIESELLTQIDQFVSGVGRLPDFIDGHQHIQQLPIVRKAILKVYEERFKASLCYIRCVNDPNAFFRYKDSGYIKKCIIQLCGASAFKKELIDHNIPHNSSFSGIYDFKDSKRFSSLFPSFLEDIKENGIIMCHPGMRSSDIPDSEDDLIASSRFLEYEYLLSDQFTELCATKQITLGRFVHDRK